MRLRNGNATILLLCETGVGTVKQKVSIYSFVAVSVIWLTSCTEKTEFVSSQSQSNWKSADPAALAGADPEPTPDIMPQTHYAAGRLFEKQGAVVRAAKQYKKALLRDPEHVPSLSRLGMIYAKQAHYPQAEQYLQKAVELWPNSPQTRNNLGFCYVMQERWYDAEAEFRNTLKLDPSFVRARVNLAMALSKQNRFDESLGEFRLAVPEPEAYYNLGLLYRSAQRYEEAASAFATALKRQPDMTLAKQQLDRMKLQMARTRELQFDNGGPQSTEFASSRQKQRPTQRTRTNQSFAMQPVESQSGNMASSQSNAPASRSARTASWSNQATASTSNNQSFESTQPVESTQSYEASQYSGNGYSGTEYSNAPVAGSQGALPMQPIEYSPSQPQSQQQESSPAYVQDDGSSSEDMTASNATQQSSPHWSNNSSVATYEMQPVASTSESLETNESTEHPESEQSQQVQWDQSHFVASEPADQQDDANQQNDSSSNIQSVQPSYVAAEPIESNASPSQQPAQVKPIPRPTQSQNFATSQTTTPATSTQSQNALVLEATPVEESYAPSKTSQQQYELVESKPRSQSTMTPAETQTNSSFTADLTEIKSMEPVAPGTTIAPKKARTATHKPNSTNSSNSPNSSDSNDVEVRPMGKIGMAPTAQTPTPRAQAMPKSKVATKPAPEQAIEPAIIEMTPVEESGDNDDDNSDSAKIEENIEVVEMEVVED